MQLYGCSLGIAGYNLYTFFLSIDKNATRKNLICINRVYGSFLGYSDSIVFDGTGIRSILRSIFFVLPDYPGLCSNANSCKKHERTVGIQSWVRNLWVYFFDIIGINQWPGFRVWYLNFTYFCNFIVIYIVLPYFSLLKF